MGGFKLTTDEIKNIITKRDGCFIEEKIENHRRHVKIKCSVGHEWWALLNNLKDGDWCKKCKDKELIIDREKILKLLITKRYLLITPGKLARTSRIKVKCVKHNYVWETCYHNIKYNNGKHNCPLCIHNYPAIEIMEQFLQQKHGTLIKVIKTKDSAERNFIVKCNKHNIVFKTRWNVLQKDKWCSKCDDEDRKITHEQIKTLVESKSGTLLDKNCFTATMLFSVKCNITGCGKEWKTSYSRIQQGCWCPRCSDCEKYTLEKIQQLVKIKGGTLLDDHFDNAHQKINIKCDCGNIFSVYFCNFIRGAWCQICDNRHTVQKDLLNIIKNIFPNKRVDYNYRGFRWLRQEIENAKTMEIDIWIPEIKLAIEYDGKQHFKPVRFARTMTDEVAERVCEDIKKRDRLKDALIA